MMMNFGEIGGEMEEGREGGGREPGSERASKDRPRIDVRRSDILLEWSSIALNQLQSAVRGTHQVSHYKDTSLTREVIKVI